MRPSAWDVFTFTMIVLAVLALLAIGGYVFIDWPADPDDIDAPGVR